MRRGFILFAALLLGACADTGLGGLFGGQTQAPPVQDGSAEPHPKARPGSERPAPATGANTAETLDTTSAEERAQAVAEAQASGEEQDLGVTIASLGAVSEAGIWMKTPLVDAPARGRVEYPEKGTRVAVDLIPLDAEPGAGSRMSLAAMRLLEADLTSLPEVRVFRLP